MNVSIDLILALLRTSSLDTWKNHLIFRILLRDRWWNTSNLFICFFVVFQTLDPNNRIEMTAALYIRILVGVHIHKASSAVPNLPEPMKCSICPLNSYIEIPVNFAITTYCDTQVDKVTDLFHWFTGDLKLNVVILDVRSLGGTFYFSKPEKCKPQYFTNRALNQKLLHQIPRTMSKEHTCQVSGHSSLPVLQEVALKLKNSPEIRWFKDQASFAIACKPQPLKRDISKRESQISLPFFAFGLSLPAL